MYSTIRIQGRTGLAYNRNKSLAKAQKLLQKGKVADAIKVYQEIVENDPTDVRNLLKIGDLEAKLGNIDSATQTYQKVGDHYAKDGFFLKAVAVFKQILKLDPGAIHVYLRLAELYQQLGLNSEAMKQYQVVARHYETQGLKKESLDTLRKMAELEPENTASKIKLAELYAKEGHIEAAGEQFKTVAAQLAEKSNHQELTRVYEKMEQLNLADADRHFDLTELYLKNAEPKKALNRLQQLFQKDPKNIKVLELLARCFTDLQQLDKARSVYTELKQILDASGQIEERDRIEAKLRALGIAEVVSAPVEGVPQVSASDELSSGAGLDDLGFGRPSDEIPETHIQAKEDGEVPIDPKILEEVDHFVQYGLLEKAGEALTRAVLTNPGSALLRTRLIEVFHQQGDEERLKETLDLCLKAARAMQLGPTVISSIEAEIGGSQAPADVSSPLPPAEEPQEVPEAAAPQIAPEPEEDEISIDLPDMEIVDDEADAPATAEAQPVVQPEMEVAPEPDIPVVASPDPAEFGDLTSDELDGAVEIDPGLEPEGISLDGMEVSSPSFDKEAKKASDVIPDLGLDDEALEAPETLFESDPKAAEPAVSIPEAEFEAKDEVSIPAAEFDLPESEEPVAVEAPKPPPPVRNESIEAKEEVEEVEEVESKPPSVDLDQEDPFVADMEEAEFFIGQGFLEEARDRYETILAQDPKYQPALNKLAELNGVEPKLPKVTADEQPERRRRARTPAPEPEVPAEKKKKPGRRKPAVRFSVQSETPPSEDLFDLSTELEDEITQLEDDLARAKAVDEEEFLTPEEVISEFKKGVARTVDKEDHQTHYNLGIAYKEMGLLDEALHEFELASGNADLSIDCASMMGLCLMGKREFETAIGVYRKALARVSPQAEEALGLSYELGEAYLGHGNIHDAYKLFARIRDADPTFRDCRRRAKELEMDLGASAPPPSAPERPKAPKKTVAEIKEKKSKISYI